MIRLENNTPSVYTEQSRDFQLFCRLYDCVNNGVINDINGIIDILDPTKINDAMLPLLCTKVGFFPKRAYSSDILRGIISTFPYAVKYKGTITGIEMAVSTMLKIEGYYKPSGQEDTATVQVDNNKHSIVIYTLVPIQNKNALEDFLSYIIPVGYTYEIGTHEPYVVFQTIHTQDKVRVMTNPSISTSQVRGTDRYLEKGSSNEYQFKDEIEDKFIGTIGSSQIIGSDNYKTNNEYGADVSSNKKPTRDTIDKSIPSQVKIVGEKSNGKK